MRRLGADKANEKDKIDKKMMPPLPIYRPCASRNPRNERPAVPRGPGTPTLRVVYRGIGIILAALLLAPWPAASLAAREDSASLVFQKTADTRSTRIYVVQKGNNIASIFRSQMGDEPVPYALIRELNPEIKDLNRIYPGQKIVLPVRGATAASVEQAAAPSVAEPQPPVLYRVQEGDSLSRIILEEMKVDPADVVAAVKLLRQLNPGIEDLNRLDAGRILNLPPDPARSSRPLMPAPQAAPEPPSAARLADKVILEMTLKEPPPEDQGLLGLIRPVIGRMGGTVTSRGHYYIPLKEGAQVTLDCALIPVVELSDGATLLLDLGNRLSEDLKALIRASWTNYGFVPAAELGDGLAALKGIVDRSRSYTMVKAETPLILSRLPEITLLPDWIIAAKGPAKDGKTYRQALHVLADGESPLPSEVRLFLEKLGGSFTQIAKGHEAPAPSGPAAPEAPAVTDLRGLKGIALAEALLRTLGKAPVRNTAIVIFDQARDGFNLSVTADLLLTREGKRFIIQTKRLPDEFIRILKERETELIPLGEADAGRAAIETLLRGVGYSVASGHHAFRFPEGGGRPRLTIAFPALRVTAGAETLYLVDFDLTSDTLPLLPGRLGRRIAKY
jgi:hypothetical protein